MAEMHPPSPHALTELEQLLHAEIPLTRAMQVRVLRADRNGLALGAALAPNLNHKQTAFGGSLNSLATLACWGLVQLLMRDSDQVATVVIQESRIQFLRPVKRDFEAVCPRPPEAAIEKFRRMLERKGRARLVLDSTIQADGEIVCRFHGKFVAYDRQRFQGLGLTSVM